MSARPVCVTRAAAHQPVELPQKETTSSQGDSPRPWHTRCRRCRRALKTSESMQAGFGPRCMRLIQLTAAELAWAAQLELLPSTATPTNVSGPAQRAGDLAWARFWILPEEAIPNERP